MPKLGYGYALYPGSASSLPSNISGLNLWLKADAGVNTIQKSTFENKLLAYWKLDTTGWIDSSGNGRNLTLQGSLSNPAGLIGNSATGFSNSNYLITPSGLAPLSGQRTYSAWVYFNSNDIGYQMIFVQGGSQDYQSTMPFYVEGNNTLTSLFTTTPPEDNTWTNVMGTTIVPNTGVWYHLVQTLDGSIGKFYVNGNLEASSAYSGSIPAPDVDRFLLGRFCIDIEYNDNPSNPLLLDGKLDEVGIWSRALSQAEITSLYNAGAGKSYPFDGTATTNSITSWSDQSGNGNNAVPQDTLPTLQSNAINGLPSIRFNNIDPDVSRFTISNNFNLKNSSAFVVVKQISLGNGFPRILSFLGSNDDYDSNDGLTFLFNNTVPQLQLTSNANDAIIENSVADNQFALVNYKIDGSGNISIFYNGISESTGQNSAMSSQNSGGALYIGQGSQNAVASGLYGDIAEVIFYSRALTTTERKQVEGYLNAKYAIY
jgi:hypothetical protein